jgi:hypothetical protein
VPHQARHLCPATGASSTYRPRTVYRSVPRGNAFARQGERTPDASCAPRRGVADRDAASTWPHGSPPRPSDERACGRRSAGSLIAAPTPSSHTSRRGRARGGLGREESLVCLSPSCAAATARSLKQTKTKLWWVGPELRIRPAILSALESMDRTVLIQPQTYHRGPDQWLRQRVLCTCHGSCLLLTRETHACHATRRACTRHLPACAKSPSLSSRRNAMHNRWRLLIRAVIDCLFIRSGCVRGDDQMLKKKKLHDIP